MAVCDVEVGYLGKHCLKFCDISVICYAVDLVQVPALTPVLTKRLHGIRKTRDVGMNISRIFVEQEHLTGVC